MPTLNLGRVRFNWKGAYEPLTDYLEYDCVEDDGQSYVCIAPTTGTGPNDPGGNTYWLPMLVRSADYNQARQDAIDAASASSASAVQSSSSAGDSSQSASNAADEEALAEKWASEAEDVEVKSGQYSAFHYMKKAEAFGDPNKFVLTAAQTMDTRRAEEWMASVLAVEQQSSDNETDNTENKANIATNSSDIATNSSDIATNSSDIATNSSDIATSSSEIGNLYTLANNDFTKKDGSRPAWTAPTSTTLETASALSLVVGTAVVDIADSTSVTLPSLSNGTDYTVYAAADGSLQAVDADSAAPSGERAVGGFHVLADGDIATRSLWDLNWRPVSPTPRAMVLSLDGRTWADIYLADVNYTAHGYSRIGQQIADGNDTPTIPDAYGGDGSSTYGSASWWSFNDILSAAGKRFPYYQEFTALAYGVVERQAVGTDPATTQHQAGHRSACGVEQATGVMWQWGADINGSGSGWGSKADGRGDINGGIRSPLFGANWDDGSHAGSRASNWSNQPDHSNGNVGARGVCDHLNLQAER